MEYKIDNIFKTLYLLYELVTAVGENDEREEEPATESEQTLTKTYTIPVSTLHGIESVTDGTIVKAFVDTSMELNINVNALDEQNTRNMKIRLRRHY